MKATRNILLCIGTAGLTAAFYGLVNGDTFMDHFITAICGVSLIAGYFQLKNQETTKC